MKVVLMQDFDEIMQTDIGTTLGKILFVYQSKTMKRQSMQPTKPLNMLSHYSFLLLKLMSIIKLLQHSSCKKSQHQ